MTTNEAVFSKDHKKIRVERKFNAPLEAVWWAWTESDQLDQWWAPQPYRAETKTMDFREGGAWLYCMVGPDGERQWCREVFETIVPQQSITNHVSFTDEAGNTDTAFPTMRWKKEFSATGDGTTVTIEINFDSEADMQTILETGFQVGFTAGLNNLDALLAKGAK